MQTVIKGMGVVFLVKARPTAARLVTALAATASLSWLGLAGPTAASASSGTELIGTFVLSAGSCAHGSVSGTYLQMILPSGNANGPFMSNSDSPCSNQAYTPLSGGTDGGLVSGKYQPNPSPPFDSHGDALAKRITAPADYEGTAFATATDPVDPQTHAKVPVPVIYDHGGTLTGDLRSFGVTWNKQYFNQGAPKPNGSYPGSSTPLSGTYNASTGAFTMTWISQVVGGPFDKFSCDWHLTGRFEPVSKASTGSVGGSGGHANHGGGASAASGGSAAGSTTTQHGNGSAAGTGSTAGGSVGSSTSVKLPGKPGHGAASGSGGLAPEVASRQAASTTTVSRENWHASWWLLGLAVGLALLGFGSLIAMNRIQRRTTAASS